MYKLLSIIITVVLIVTALIDTPILITKYELFSESHYKYDLCNVYNVPIEMNLTNCTSICKNIDDIAIRNPRCHPIYCFFNFTYELNKNNRSYIKSVNKSKRGVNPYIQYKTECYYDDRNITETLTCEYNKPKNKFMVLFIFAFHIAAAGYSVLVTVILCIINSFCVINSAVEIDSDQIIFDTHEI